MSAARRLRDWILMRPMTYTTELDLQDAIHARLIDEVRIGVPVRGFGREVVLDAHNRIDFLVTLAGTRVGVEVKVGSSNADVVRQLTRYARFDAVEELLLVTTQARHHHLPKVVGGKPAVLCSLVGGAL